MSITKFEYFLNNLGRYLNNNERHKEFVVLLVSFDFYLINK